MNTLALLVHVQTHPGKGDEFEAHILEAAAAAVRAEPDCHQFHVGRDEADPDRFELFEVYTNAASLAFHHEQPHFKAFGERAGHLILEKSSQRLRLVSG